MASSTPVPSIEEKLRMATRMPQPRPEFLANLRAQFIEERQPLSSPFSHRILSIFRRPVWVIVSFLLILLLSVAFVGPQKVAAAFRSLFGYVPNVGFVENPETVRIADTPIQIEREGVTVTVESGAADTQGVHLSLRVDGLPEDKSIFRQRSRGAEELPYLRLSTGETLSLLSGQTQGGNPIVAYYLFSPLQTKTSDVTLVLPFLDGLEKGVAPEDWQIPLHFRTPKPNEVISTDGIEPRRSEERNGITLVIDEVAQEPESTMLKVHLETKNNDLQPNSEWWNDLSLTGQDGKIYPLTDVPALDTQGSTTTRTLRTEKFSGNENLSLRLNQLILAASFPMDDTAPGFRFNPGRNPVPGQTWKIDKTLKVNGFSLHFTQARLISENGTFQLRFEVDPQPGLSNVILGCGTSRACFGSTTGIPTASDPIQTSLSFSEVPNWPLQIRLATLIMSVQGPWQVEWKPLPLAPETLAQSSATPSPTPLPIKPTPTTVIEQPLAQEVGSLLQKGFSQLYSQPGWVHIMRENIVPDDGSFLLGPADTIGEYWQYVEADGTISKYALIVKDRDGGVWQKIARVGKKQVNFFTQTSKESENLLEKALPSNLPDMIEAVSREGGRVKQEEVILDGKDCWLITLMSTYDPPIQYAGTDIIVSSTEQKIWIDQETGDIVLQERFDHLVDRTSIRQEHVRTILQERVDAPPQEITNLLN